LTSSTKMAEMSAKQPSPCLSQDNGQKIDRWGY